MDFVVGGGLGEVSIHEWDGNEYLLVDTIGGEGCDPTDLACAFNNGGLIDGGPWPNYDRHGATITQLEPNAFTEFGVDITALLGETPCFTTFMGKTRSSQSFTAELKDFAGPEALPICGANISIAADDANEVGQSHTFTVNVFQSLGGVQTPAPNGTIATVTLTAANGAVVSPNSDTCASPGTVGGICTVTFTSNSAGQITAHAAADVAIGVPFRLGGKRFLLGKLRIKLRLIYKPLGLFILLVSFNTRTAGHSFSTSPGWPPGCSDTCRRE